MAIRFPTPFVVSYGEESFFLDKDLAQFREQHQRSITVLDGEDVSEAEVVSACTTMMVDFEDPMATKPVLVIVDNANKLKCDKQMKAYVEGKDAKDLTTVLCLIARGEKVPAFWAKLGAKVTTREFKKLKTWDNDNQVIAWIVEEAKGLGLVVDTRLAAIMFEVAGADLYRLTSELRKLQLLAGKGAVTIEHLKLVMTPGSNATPWTITEATFQKNPKRALNAISSVYKHYVEDPSLLILGALMKQMDQLFVVRSMLDKGAQPDEVAGRLGMHPYRFKMSLLPTAGKHSVRGLTLGMQTLCKLDVELKRTSQSRRTLVELAVLELSA